jgi:ferredoxin
LLVIILALIIGSRELWAGGYEPFDQLFAFVGGTTAFIFAALVLAISVFHYRFFCKYLCAVGALLGVFTWAGLKRGAPPGCEGCFECVSACDMGALEEGEAEPAIDDALCIQCGDCRTVCKCGSPPSDARWK